jgi:hypothetical protein
VGHSRLTIDNFEGFMTRGLGSRPPVVVLGHGLGATREMRLDA